MRARPRVSHLDGLKFSALQREASALSLVFAVSGFAVVRVVNRLWN